MKCLVINPDAVDLDALVARGAQLHGHCGPFLVLGIRMGLHALSLLHHPGYFGIRAESEAGTRPSLSCLNDGVQIGSGCTLGKGNLVVVGSDRPSVRFTTDAGMATRIDVRVDVLDAIRRKDISELGTELVHRPAYQLFSWTTPSAL